MRKAPVAMMAAGAFLFYIICNQIWIYIYIMIFSICIFMIFYLCIQVLICIFILMEKYL